MTDPFEHPVKAWTIDDLEMEVGQIAFTITRCDELVMGADEAGWPLERLAGVLKEMREDAGYLRDVLSSLERLVGDRMSDFRQTIEGVGTLERHKNESKTKWRKDELLAAVLDTRLVNAETGELVEETPLEKVLHVFNLPAPRTTALKARGLAYDEFCEVENKGGYTVAIR